MNSNKPLAKERAKIERNMASQNFPKIKTLQKWKNDFSWLNVNHSQGMTCKLCVKWEKTIESSKNYSEAFVKGSKNYRRSAVAEHEKTTQHDKSKELEEEERCKASGAVYRKTVTQVKIVLYQLHIRVTLVKFYYTEIRPIIILDFNSHYSPGKKSTITPSIQLSEF